MGFDVVGVFSLLDGYGGVPEDEILRLRVDFGDGGGLFRGGEEAEAVGVAVSGEGGVLDEEGEVVGVGIGECELAGQQQRKKMNIVVMINKGKSFVGFEPISMDEVFRDLILLYLPMEQRKSCNSYQSRR
ncbi:hypothetical protein F2Q70_00045441 [Brassica cretica]|uniref:Uncharacterized protein n=1 Tax=Brassica cretica TaxID=69181 RepID=A0A8S9KMX5_BRACR|nr:hypothetical protein F2Q70_00045441 [Brassica cretica]